MAVQYAKALGIRIIAIDSGEEKRKLCLASGAEHFIDFKTENALERVKEITGGGAHGVGKHFYHLYRSSVTET